MILLIGGTGYVGLKFQEILSQRNIEFIDDKTLLEYKIYER